VFKTVYCRNNNERIKDSVGPKERYTKDLGLSRTDQKQDKKERYEKIQRFNTTAARHRRLTLNKHKTSILISFFYRMSDEKSTKLLKLNCWCWRRARPERRDAGSEGPMMGTEQE
jgi:hypothetical protein